MGKKFVSINKEDIYYSNGCVEILITDDRLTDLFGRYDKQRQKIVNHAGGCTDILQSFSNDIQKNRGIISDIINTNKIFLKKYDITGEINYICQNLSSFIKLYFKEKWAEDMKENFYKQIIVCRNNKDTESTYDQLATILTWMLLLALLRQFSINIKRFCPFIIYETHQRKKFIIQNKIRPITMGFSEQKNTYIPRNDYLEKLKNDLQKNDGKKHYVILSGIGGSGKSELARSYAWNEKNLYQDILWITCKDNISKNDLTLEAILKNDYPNLQYDILDEWSEDYLIIIDNCNIDNSEFFEQILHETGKAQIIITSRLSFFEDLPLKHLIFLDNPEIVKNDIQFTHDVFEKNYTLINRNHEKKKLHPEEDFYVWSICKLIGYNTMLTVMLAAELREYNTNSIRDFYFCLKNGLQYAIPNGSSITYKKDRERFKDNIPTILRVIFQDLLSHSFTNLEKQILTILKLHPARQFHADFIYELLGDNSTQKYIQMTCNNLQDMGWIQRGQGWIAIHPLIAEMLELDENDTLIAKEDMEEFYKHIAKNLLVMKPNLQKKEESFFNLFRFTLEKNTDNLTLNIALSSILYFIIPCIGNHSSVEAYCKKMFPQETLSLIIMTDHYHGKIFWTYSLNDNTKTILFNLTDQKRKHRYWNMSLDKKIETISNKKEFKNTANLLFLICNKKDISDIKIPNKIENKLIYEIPDYFFCHLKNIKIKKLILPTYLKFIGDKAFLDSLIESIQISNTNQYYTVKNYCLYDKTFTRLIYCPLNYRSHYILPDSVHFVSQYAFGSNNKEYSINNMVPYELYYFIKKQNNLSPIEKAIYCDVNHCNFKNVIYLAKKCINAFESSYRNEDLFFKKYLSNFYYEELFDCYVNDYLKVFDEDNFQQIYELFYNRNFYYLEDIIIRYLEIFELPYDYVQKCLNQLERKLGKNYIEVIGMHMSYLEYIDEEYINEEYW